MKPEILELLQCSSHQLEMQTIKHYMFWCEIYVEKDNELQTLLANTALFNWWMSEYKKLQLYFVKIAKPYKNVANKYDLRRLYDTEAMKIKHIYSKPLLRNARISNYKIEGNPQYN